MSDIYDEISTRVMAFMRNPINNFLIIKSHVGSGKTTNTLKTLHDEGEVWIYLAPFHTVVSENLELSPFRRFEYHHLKSRAKLCLIPDYKALAQRYINIRPVCENNCPLKDSTCPYYEIKRKLLEDPTNWAGVHHHLPEFLQDFFDMWIQRRPMYSYYDVLIIDENPINVLFDNETANAEQLAGVRDMIIRLNVQHPHRNRVERFLNYLIEKFPGNIKLNYDELFPLIHYTDFRAFYETYQQALVDSILLGIIQIHELPRDYLDLFSKMERYITQDMLPSMIIKRGGSAYTRKAYYFMYFNNRALLDCPIPKIIGLDGTANIELWETIVGREASILDRGYRYNNLYQLTDGRYPLSTWIRKRKITSSGLRLINLMNSIISKKRSKVLIVCTKPMQPYIEKNLMPKLLGKVVFGNYYYLRSRNDFYESCDTVILACEPNLPEFQIESFVQLSGWDIELWRKVFTEEEMIQAIGRIREEKDMVFSRRREKREVYILSNVPLFEESHRLEYFDLLEFIKTGRVLGNIQQIEMFKLLSLIPDNDHILKTKLKQNARKLRMYGKKFDDLYYMLEEKGFINQDGRKGIQRIN